MSCVYKAFLFFHLILKLGGALFNYRLTDVNGKVLGIVSLERESIPRSIMDGGRFYLEGSYVSGERKFLSFMLVPVEKTPAEEVQTRNADGELKFFANVEAAFAHVERDPTVWKISWGFGPTGNRIRLVKNSRLKPGPHGEDIWETIWIYEPLDIPEILDPDDAKTVLGRMRRRQLRGE